MEGVFYTLIYLTLAEIRKTTTECFLMYDFKLFALASVSRSNLSKNNFRSAFSMI